METTRWLQNLNGNPLPWLGEPDPANPAIRYFTLVELLEEPHDSPQARQAMQAAMRSGPVPLILAAQHPQGYWVKPGPGYGPKYQGTVWQVIFLAQLGADGSDPRVRRACDYAIANQRCAYGGFSMDGSLSGLIHCMQGNLVAALIDLGWLGDERLAGAIDWLARSITGEGIAPAQEKNASPRYYRSGNSGPDFACSANNHLPCAWGAVKAALALSKIPPSSRTGEIHRAITATVDFLLSQNPAEASYPTPTGGKPSRSWFQFGYPVGYVTDVLQTLEALTALGITSDPRIVNGVEYVLGKQDGQGRWKMEYSYNGKTWADIEQKGQPSKWITLRALRVIKRVYCAMDRQQAV